MKETLIALLLTMSEKFAGYSGSLMLWGEMPIPEILKKSRANQKKKLIKTGTVVLLTFCFISGLIVHAETDTAMSEVGDDPCETIMVGYEENREILQQALMDGAIDQTEFRRRMDAVQEETVYILNEAGIPSYHVTADNYDIVQNELRTDFSVMGMTRENSYILSLTGETAQKPQGDAQINRTEYQPFTYVFWDTPQTLRYVRLTAADDPLYGKTSTVNLYNTTSYSIIQNTLNAAVASYLDYISAPWNLGTIASICGLTPSAINTSQTASLYFNAGTNWTRFYTQVYSTYDNMWISGSCTEYVTRFSYMSGLYYSAASNSYVPVNEERSTRTTQATHCYDYEWRKYQACLGYVYSTINYDTTGKARYEKNGSVIVTHLENF